MAFLTIWDLLITPVFLFLLIVFARRHRDINYPEGHPLRKYYLKGLYAKFGGAIFIGLVYAFYYKTGDTYYYYVYANNLNSSLATSLGTWWDLMLHTPVSENPRLYPFVTQIQVYGDPSSYTTIRITAFLGLTNGTTYMPTALLFAYISYTGIWAMFKVFAEKYPDLQKQLAIAFLFIPSVVIWGSGIFKDTICMFGLGWMTYTTFRVFVYRDFSIKNLSILAFSFWLISVVKVYILLAFLPALMLWVLMTYSKKIKIFPVRVLFNLVFIALTIGGFLYFTEVFAKELNRYSLENITKTSQSTRDWIEYASKNLSDQGSSYSLGEFDNTVSGMLSKFPQAVVVTLFRPYLWEAKKVIVVLSAIESLLFLYFTLKAFVFGRNSFKSYRLVFRDPNVLFFLIFSLVFAFAVGVSTYNFGALSRYKIPCLPFYSALLMVMLNYHNKVKNKD